VFIIVPPSAARDYEEKTVSSSVVTLDSNKYSGVTGEPSRTAALITCEDADVRYMFDSTGNNPTSSTGHLLTTSGGLLLQGVNNLKNFRCIAATSSDGTLKVTYLVI
jgi:hypothetical protein